MHIKISTPVGAPIVGKLTHTDDCTTLLVICHGYRSTPDHPAIKIVTADLIKQGYATFAFKFTSSPSNIRGHVADIQAIADYFDKKYTAVVLLTTSLGALSGSIATARSPKIGGLITVNGFFGLTHLGPQFKSEFLFFRLAALLHRPLKEIWQFYKTAFRPQDIHVPVLVIHSPTDKEVFVAQSRYFFSKLTTNKEFKELKLTDHGLSQPQDAHAIAAVVAGWLPRNGYATAQKQRKSKNPGSIALNTK